LLQQKFNVDLTQIPQKPELTIDKNSPLIAHLNSLLQQAHHSTFGEGFEQILLEPCEKTTTSRDKKWQPQQADDIIDKTTAKLSKTPDLIAPALHEIDPDLVDIYRDSLSVEPVKLSPEERKKRDEDFDVVFEAVDQSYRLFNAGKPDEAIASILSTPFRTDQKQWLLWRTVLSGRKYVNEIVNSKLMLEPLQYGLYKRSPGLKRQFIEQLHQAGANIDQPDEKGKSLVFYAAEMREPDALKYLYENQFTYHFSELGKDPLDVALRLARFQPVPDTFLPTISELMNFQPEIKVSHLQRVQVIKLFFPNVYDQMIELHPDFTVDVEVPLPAIH